MPWSPVRSTIAVAPGGAWPRGGDGLVAVAAARAERVSADRDRHEQDRRHRERRARDREQVAPGAPARARAGGRVGASSASARTVAISRSRSAGRRLDLLDRGRQHLDGGAQPAGALLAARAAVEVALEAARLVARQRVEQVGGEVVLEAQVVVLLVHTPSASFALILSIASRIRPFTVPSGMPSTSAISEWVRPPK